MSAPIRELILSAINTAVDGAYGVKAPEDERDLPLTTVIDGSDVVTSNYDTTQIAMPVIVERAERSEGLEREDLRAQANDVLAALITAMCKDETFKGLAIGTDYTGGHIVAEANKYVYAQANFTVRYQHLRGQPATAA